MVYDSVHVLDTNAADNISYYKQFATVQRQRLSTVKYKRAVHRNNEWDLQIPPRQGRLTLDRLLSQRLSFVRARLRPSLILAVGNINPSAKINDDYSKNKIPKGEPSKLQHWLDIVVHLYKEQSNSQPLNAVVRTGVADDEVKSPIDHFRVSRNPDWPGVSLQKDDKAFDEKFCGRLTPAWRTFSSWLCLACRMASGLHDTAKGALWVEKL